LCSPHYLWAHNFHQIRIDIHETDELTEWTIFVSFHDIIGMNDIDVDTKINADFDENVKAIMSEQSKLKEWIKTCVKLRKLSVAVEDDVINDPDFKVQKPILPNFYSEDEALDVVSENKPMVFPFREVVFNNLKISIIDAYDAGHRIIDEIQFKFIILKQSEDSALVFSQHFSADYFEKDMHCTINFTTLKNIKNPPLILPKSKIAVFSFGSLRSESKAVFQFILEGFFHILKGLDHLAFLFALILIHHRFKSLLVAISLFTVGHCVSLLIAGLDYWVIPADIIEPLIAFSIMLSAYHAWKVTKKTNVVKANVESFYWNSVIVLFGLIHGFGFSFLIRDMLEPGESIILWLFSFNLGIELGQAVFLIMTFLVFKLLCFKEKYFLFLRYFICILLMLWGGYLFTSSL